LQSIRFEGITGQGHGHRQTGDYAENSLQGLTLGEFLRLLRHG